jgi:hypothetical protein
MNDESTRPMMALKGRSGDGKTILLGKLALDIEVNLNVRFFFIILLILNRNKWKENLCFFIIFLMEHFMLTRIILCTMR